MNKTIYKPWGKEIWLELNDKYCYKRIYINSGHRTSYQYHDKKMETNYIISGKAEVWLENDNGDIDKQIMNGDDFFTVLPGRKHRVIALTDIILQEVSTPEVDDVIRISDDTNRNDGKIDREYKKPALCIIAAGIGSRMGNYSNLINKGLLPIDNKAVISNIIDKTPKEYDIVVAVGYRSELIIEYCKSAHDDRNFIFVNVDKFIGEGTGPGTSLLCCKEYLQRPFYFVTSDCYIKDELPFIDDNWLGVYQTSLPEMYATVKVDRDENIQDFKNKTKDGYNNAFIGLCSILDYNKFWNKLEDNILDSGEVVSAFYNINNYDSFIVKKLDWYDIGTIDNYIKSKKIFDTEKFGIEKTNGQFVYKIEDKFIKLFSDKNLVVNKIHRSENLKGLTPKIKWSGEHVFSYEWFDGNTLYEINDIKVWKKFLDWGIKNLWEVEDYDIYNNCKIFYKDKTIKRYNMFVKNKGFEYFHDEYIINNKSYKNIIDDIKFDDLFDGIPTKLYHGDLQFDNVLYNGDTEKYSLIDWRDDFGGSNDFGDVYYDLSKMYGGIIMSYSSMKYPKNYNFSKEGNYITYDYIVDEKLLKFKEYYENWILENGFDLNKIKKITSLIYLNMSPLHCDDFDDILYFQSIKMLNDLNF